MAVTLQALIDAAQANPDDPQAAIGQALADANLTPDAVAKLQAEAVEAFHKVAETSPTGEDDIAGMEALADVVDATKSVQAAAEASAAEHQARLDALAARVGGQPTDDDPDPEGPPADAPDLGAPPLVPDEDDDEADAAALTDTTVDTPAGGQPAEPDAAAPLAASAKPRRRFNLSALQSKAPTPTPKKDAPAMTTTIVASADVAGFATGQRLTGFDDVVAAAQAKMSAMPVGVEGITSRAGIAQIRRHFPTSLVASGANDEAVVAYATDPTRLNGGSLVAAGGWCSPSELIFDLPARLESASAGLVDIPDIQVKRGGIRITEGVDFSSIWTGNVGLIQTEAQSIAGDLKQVYRIPCVAFDETRADAVYTIVEGGILANDSFPELAKDVLSGVDVAHAHKINASSIARMEAQSTAVDMTVTMGPSAVGSLLNGLGLLIVDYRYRYRADESMQLEVILPIWLKEVVRADYALRGGIPMEQVGDPQVNAWFADRGARVQWVYDWQDAYTGVASGFGAATAKTSFPTTVKALIYAAGAFVRGRGEILTLDAVYDSTNLPKNDFLHLFMEEKLLVKRRAYRSYVATFPLAVNGATGIGRQLDGNGKIVVAP